MVELLESLIYMILDFSINQTASAAQGEYSFPVSKGEAKHMLVFANEMLYYILRLRDSRKRVLTTEERHFMEKVYPAVCKLVTYMGGYLH